MAVSRRFLFLIFLLSYIQLMTSDLFSQEVPQPANNFGIYEFLDELANNQIISINSVVKPYSRLFIANKLKEAEGNRVLLNPRQLKELDFYLLDFGKELREGNRGEGGKGRKGEGEMGRKGEGEMGRKGEGVQWLKGEKNERRFDLFYYKDSLFSLTVNPILGGEVFVNEDGVATYWRNGVEARGYVQRWGFYASLRDNHEKPLLGLSPFLTQREGGHLKGTGDWSEMQGGITYSWKWGSAGLVKDKLQWGNNYNGANIFGGNNPSFVQFRLHIAPVKWFDFNYFHGWLNSMVVDSSRSYWVNNSYGTDYREVYHKKFIAANIFTFIPFKYLNISAGNSIVYSDLDLFPAYLIPVLFYKSVDHSVNDGIDNMNSQMFFDISSRQLNHLHLYGTVFIDELSVSRIFEKPKTEWNFLSYKAGFRVTDFPVSNLSFTTEFTYTYPLAFQHYVPTLTFESNSYNLGHYLRDNSREWFISLGYRPVRSMNITLYYIDAVRGPDYTVLGTDRVGNPPLASVQWHNTTAGIKGSYQIINDVYSWFSFSISNIRGDSRWSPEYFYGKKNTLNAGLTVGF
jgi:hypothetical protein